MIVQVVEKFWAFRFPGFRPPPPALTNEFATALTKSLAERLPPSFDEVVAALRGYIKHTGSPYGFACLKVYADGAGIVLGPSDDNRLFHWDPTDTPGKTAIAAFKTFTKPKPTAKEKALEACEKMLQLRETFSGEYGLIMDNALASIRRALEEK